MRTRNFLTEHRSLCITLCAVALAVLFFLVTGLRLCAVQSGSMEPNIPTYSMCLVSTRVGYDDLAIGDVVVYTRAYDGKRIIHRVHEVVDDGIITKGDANSFTDGISVTPGNLYGKYVAHIPYLAHVYNAMHSPFGVVFIFLLIAVLVVIEIFEAKQRGRTTQGHATNTASTRPS